jgi:hypothetical protein
VRSPTRTLCLGVSWEKVALLRSLVAEYRFVLLGSAVAVRA